MNLKTVFLRARRNTTPCQQQRLSGLARATLLAAGLFWNAAAQEERSAAKEASAGVAPSPLSLKPERNVAGIMDNSFLIE